MILEDVRDGGFAHSPEAGGDSHFQRGVGAVNVLGSHQESKVCGSKKKVIFWADETVAIRSKNVSNSISMVYLLLDVMRSERLTPS